MHHPPRLAPFIRTLLLIPLIALSASPSGAQPLETKLTASDGEAGDYFGISTATDGSRIVVGASRHDQDPNFQTGAVYVFDHADAGWMETILLVDDAAHGDNLGYAVDVDGDRIVAGAYLADAGPVTDAGAAYVFDFDAGAWQQSARLVAGDGAQDDQIGLAVAVQGDRIVVGAPRHDVGGVRDVGAVYVFERIGEEWVETAKLTAAGGSMDDHFGWDVALDGDRIVVGAWGYDGFVSQMGAAFVFDYDGSTWQESAVLTASDAALNDMLGSSVAVLGDRITAGSPRDDNAKGTDAGAVYVFELAAGSWTQVDKLIPADASAGGQVGYAVSLAEDHIVAGAWLETNAAGAEAGAVYVFEADAGGWSSSPIRPSDGAAGDNFGGTVSIANDLLVAGAFQHSDRMGAAYVYGTPTVVENTPPVARTDYAFTATSTPVAVDPLANDYDPDGDPLTISGLGTPQHGGLEWEGDQLIYHPNAGFEGSDQFSYAISDGRGEGAEATVYVRIAAPSTQLFTSFLEEQPDPRPEVVRRGVGVLNLDYVLGLAASDGAPLTLNLFDDVMTIVDQDGFEQWSETDFSWLGRAQRQGDQVTLEIDLDNRLVFATIWVDGRSYRLEQVDGDRYAILEIDTAFLVDDPYLDEPDPDVGDEGSFEVVDGTIIGAPQQTLLQPAGKQALQDVNYIDLLIIYTTLARDSSGSTAGILQEIRNAVNNTNTGFRDSGVDALVRLAGVAAVVYDETGKELSDRNSLRRAGNTQGTAIYDLRQQFQADIVGLVVGDIEGCGIAYIMKNVSTSHRDRAYFVVEQGNCLGNNLSFAHEIGHIMGARHDRFVDNTDGSPYDYNHGYVNPPGTWTVTGDQWRTIMAYNDECDCTDESGGFLRECPVIDNRSSPRTPSCTRQNVWSDPNATWNGSVRGVASGDNAADNVRTLNNTASTVAAFMSGLPTVVGTITDAETGSGLAGVEVEGNDGTTIRTVITDPEGFYSMALPTGSDVVITPVLDGYTFDPGSRSYSNLQQDVVANFDAFELFTISGTIEQGSTPLEGIELRGTGQDIETDADGNYEITLPYGWSGAITPHDPAYTFTPEKLDVALLDQDLTQDFDATRNRYTIQGVITEVGGAPVAGVELRGFPSPRTTTFSGAYAITVDHGWSGVVTPVKPGYDFEPFSREYINLSGDRQHDYDAYPGGLARSGWPVYMANGRHTGAVSAQTVHSTIAWTQILSGAASAPVVGPDGTIFVGTDDRLYALDSAGNILWDELIPFIGSSPVVGTGATVYVGDTGISGRLTAYDYVDRTVKWEYNTGGPITAPPTIGHDGTIYVGSNSDMLHAVDPAGTAKWTFPTGGDIASSPALASDGTVYIGSDDGNLYAVNPDGSERWRFATGGSVQSSPSIGADETIYVGSDRSRLYAISPTGSELWHFDTDGPVKAAPAIDSNGNLYVGTTGGTFYAVSSSGQLRWQHSVGSPITSSAVISQVKVRLFTTEQDEEVVYVASEDGVVRAFDITSLTSSSSGLRWTSFLPGTSPSTPMITDRGMFIGVGGSPGRLVALQPVSRAWTQGLVMMQDGVLTEREVAIAIWMEEVGGPLGIIGGGFGDDPCTGGPLIIPDCPYQGGTFGDVSPYVSVLADHDLVVGFADASFDLEAIVNGQSTDGLIGTLPTRFEEGTAKSIIVSGLASPDGFAPNPDGISTSYALYETTSISTNNLHDEQVHLIAGHFSTDSPELQISLIGESSHQFEPLKYGETTQLASVPPGQYELLLEPAGTPGKASAALSQTVNLTGRAGEVVMLLAAGFMDPEANQNGPPLSIYTATPTGTESPDARGLLVAANERLETLAELVRSSGERKLLELLEEALVHLAKALSDEYWSGDSRLSGMDGEDVFDESKDAVRESWRFVERTTHGGWRDEAAAGVRQIASAMDVLAVVAIEDAASACTASDSKSCTGQLDRAQQQYVQGQAQFSDDELEASVRSFARAWEYATEALLKLGDQRAVADAGDLPSRYELFPNYPNPFNPHTVIRFAVPEAADVRLEVFDVLGRRVRVLVDDMRPAGRHEVVFDAGDLSSGLYFYRLQAGDVTFTRRMTLLR